MHIRLLVLRSPNPQALADFYTLLGATFEYHRHGNAPYHFSATLGTMTLEIYPLATNQIQADEHLRLGFEIENFEEILAILQEKKIPFSIPIQTDFGFMTLLKDPDGRKVEVYKKT